MMLGMLRRSGSRGSTSHRASASRLTPMTVAAPRWLKPITLRRSRTWSPTVTGIGSFGFGRQKVRRTNPKGGKGTYPTPSRADIEMTREIEKAAKALGIAVHDHLVIGRGGHASFKSLGLL